MKRASALKRLLSLVLCLCMVLSLLPTIAPVEAEAAEEPSYISGIYFASDSSKSDAQNRVRDAGYTLIDYDLNKGAAGKYIYMGYKTTSDFREAITGIFFSDDVKNPPDSYVFPYNGSYVTAYKVSSVDLNDGCGIASDYIYAYTTTEVYAGSPITEIQIKGNNSINAAEDDGIWTIGRQIDTGKLFGTDGRNLNAATIGDKIYLHYKQYSKEVTATYWYLDDYGNRQQYVMTKTATNALMGFDFDMDGYPTMIKYNGDNYYSDNAMFREDDLPIYEKSGPRTVTPSTTGKVMRAVYERTNVYLVYDLNGGSGTFDPQFAKQVLNAGASSLVVGDVVFTLSSNKPTYAEKCAFLGWSTDQNATTAMYQPGETIVVKDDTILYAVWRDHKITHTNVCDHCGSLEQPALKNGVYQISNLAQLVWFQQYVNQGNKSANAILLNDIDMGGYNWTPMATTGQYLSSDGSDKGYTGTFDGNGKCISNFKIYASAGYKTHGLFGTVSGTVKNLAINNLYMSGDTRYMTFGGVAGQLLSGGTIENCSVTDSKIYAADNNIHSDPSVAGGIAGGNYGGTVKDCYVYNSIVTGSFNAAYGEYWVGDIVGQNCGSSGDRRGYVINCYTDDHTSTIGSFPGFRNEATAMTAAQFRSGEVTYKLNGGATSSQRWFQTCGTGLPAFSGKTVYCGYTTCSESQSAPIYSNDASLLAEKPIHFVGPGTCTTPDDCPVCGDTYKGSERPVHDEGVEFDDDGFCPYGCYLPAADDNSDGVYEITKAGQLFWFAQQVNDGDYDANAILMNDIDLEGREWTTICSTDLYHSTTSYSDKIYTGTFDGQGYAIRNFVAKGISGSNCSVGLFGTVKGATVKNLGIDGMTFELNGATDVRAAAIVGQMLEGSLIENCYVINSTLTPNNFIVGGVAACNYGGTIANCYTKNVTISANDRCGNLVSDTCGDIKGSEADRPGTVINCWTDAARVAGTQSGNLITGCGENMTEEQFGSGEVAYALGDAWGQNIGTDALPVPGGMKVYRGYTKCSDKECQYSNSVLLTTIPLHNFSADGFCTSCDAYQSAEGEGTMESPYLIGNAGQLYWYAAVVNTGYDDIAQDYDAYAELTANITVNEGVLNADGTLNGDGSSFRQWTPISGEEGFRGVLDGKGFTISGLYFESDTADNVGFMGCVYYDGTVRNLGILDSYMRGNRYVGGIAGFNEGSSTTNCYNAGTVIGNYYAGGVFGETRGDISNCYNTGTVIGNYYAGGVVGYASTFNISNLHNSGSVTGNEAVGGVVGYVFGGDVSRCYNTGTVTGVEYVGGVSGYQIGDFTNCYNMGSVSGTTYIGGVIGYGENDPIVNCYNIGSVSGTDMVGALYGATSSYGNNVYNCYYLDTCGTAKKGYSRTAEQFASGEVAYQLSQGSIVSIHFYPGDSWGQTIGTDAYPVLDGAKVYNGYTSCADEEKVYTNSENVVSEKIPHVLDATTGICACGYTARACVIVDEVTTYYVTLNEAVEACGNYTAEDKALLKLLDNVALGKAYLIVASGVFTVDLNGFELSNTDIYGAFYVDDEANVTVTDSDPNGNGKISGKDGLEVSGGTLNILGGTITGSSDGVHVYSGTLNILGGTITGSSDGVYVYNGTLDIDGGTITGNSYGVTIDRGTLNIDGGSISGTWGGVYSRIATVNIAGGTITTDKYGVYNVGTVRITGGTIISNEYGVYNNGDTMLMTGGTIISNDYGVYTIDGTVTISGGSICAERFDLVSDDDGSIVLTLDEGATEGVTFPHGLTVSNITLNEVLGEGTAYWIGDKQITVADDAVELIDGDVTVKAICDHSGNNTPFSDNGDGTHGCVCSVCDKTVSAEHSWLDATCTEPKTCADCKLTEGEALGHNFVDSKCDNPGCGAWQTFTMTYYVDGEKVHSEIYTTGSAYYLWTAEDKDDLTFLGWATEEGGELVYAVGEYIWPGADMQFYAVYGKLYTINYHNYDSEIDDYWEAGSAQVIAGNSIVLGTQYSYWFKCIGWATQPGGEMVYAVGQEITPVGDLELYAVAVPFQVTIDLGAEDATYVDENGDPITVLSGTMPYSTVYLTNFPIRPGYVFLGFDYYDIQTNEQTGERYIEISMTEDITVTAQWELCSHSWNDATCTAPKTCADCKLTEGEALGHKDADNSGRCDNCQMLMQPAKLCMASISLNGNIAVNYYMLLSDEVVSDAAAYMQFTLADGEIQKIPVSEGVKIVRDGETYYAFTCAVDAKEMTDDIITQFFYEGGSTKAHTYSVQTYAKNILANNNNEATRNLMTAMLNYGAACQRHFGYNTDDLANTGVTENPDYSNVTIEGFNAVAGQGTENARFYSASLLLKSETTLRFFFTGKVTATYNGQTLEVKERSGLYYVDVVGIAAKDLDEDVTITINDGSNTAEVSFNPMSYCQSVLNDTTGAFDQKAKDVVAALYLYNQAANVYFKEI